MFEFDERNGDLNHDGEITVADVIIALQMVVRCEYRYDADVDGDGCVNALDARMIIQAAIPTQTK